MDDYDAIIIGTGQSGPSPTKRLVAAGQKVAVIERKFFGGAPASIPDARPLRPSSQLPTRLIWRVVPATTA